MQDSSTQSGAIAQIDALCVAIERAVAEADWDTVGILLSRRRESLDALFAGTPADTHQASAIKKLSEKIMAFDRVQLPLINAARSETAEQLKALQVGRRATTAYQNNSG